MPTGRLKYPWRSEHPIRVGSATRSYGDIWLKRFGFANDIIQLEG